MSLSVSLVPPSAPPPLFSLSLPPSLSLSVCLYLSILCHITVLKYFFPLLVSVCLSVLSLCLSERGERLHWGFKNMFLYQFYFSYRMSHGLLMVRWIVGSIPNGGPIEQFLVPASAPVWYNKDRGMCCLVCEMVHMKDL